MKACQYCLQVVALREDSDAAVRWSAVKTIEQMGQQIKSIRFLKQGKEQTCEGMFGQFGLFGFGPDA